MGGTTSRSITALLGLALVLVPVATAQTSSMTGPIENGDFEGPFVPRTVYAPAEGGPADECIGIGHQVLYGPESPAGYATGGKAGDPDPSTADPQKTAENTTNSPVYWADYEAGYGHCVFEPNGRGEDVVWLNPVDRVKQPAMWSVHPFYPSTVFSFEADNDPFDREAVFLPEDPDQPRSNHNLWQSYVSQPGVYTANFDALEFTVEAGEIPNPAVVRISLSGTPLDGQSPWLAGYQDCILTFGSELFEPGQDGDVRVDPLDARLRSDGDAGEYCETAVETFNDPDASEEDKRDALGRLRMVQISFWEFNVAHGEEPVAIDDVAMPGATTAAEEAATGNVNPDPRFNPDDV